MQDIGLKVWIILSGLLMSLHKGSETLQRPLDFKTKFLYNKQAYNITLNT